jgi:hypothetical protein
VVSAASGYLHGVLAEAAEVGGPTVEWNFAYLLGLAIVWTSLAFVRDRRGPGSLVFAGAGLGLAVAGAILQTPPGGYL